jgi:hypothetical protein
LRRLNYDPAGLWGITFGADLQMWADAVYNCPQCQRVTIIKVSTSAGGRALIPTNRHPTILPLGQTERSLASPCVDRIAERHRTMRP